MLQVFHELWDFVSLFRYTCCDRFMSCNENRKDTLIKIPTTKRTNTIEYKINILSGDARVCEKI